MWANSWGCAIMFEKQKENENCAKAVRSLGQLIWIDGWMDGWKSQPYNYVASLLTFRLHLHLHLYPLSPLGNCICGQNNGNNNGARHWISISINPETYAAARDLKTDSCCKYHRAYSIQHIAYSTWPCCTLHFSQVWPVPVGCRRSCKLTCLPCD